MTRDEFKNKYSQLWYLGDGLYAKFDGYHIILETERENGRNWIGLEPSVFRSLIDFKKQLYEDIENIDRTKNEI